MTSKKNPMDPVDQLARDSLDPQGRTSGIRAAAEATGLSGATAR